MIVWSKVREIHSLLSNVTGDVAVSRSSHSSPNHPNACSRAPYASTNIPYETKPNAVSMLYVPGQSGIRWPWSPDFTVPVNVQKQERCKNNTRQGTTQGRDV